MGGVRSWSGREPLPPRHPWGREDHTPASSQTPRHERDGSARGSDGRPYENTYAWFMRMRDGLVVDGTAFYDSISFNDLWTRVEL